MQDINIGINTGKSRLSALNYNMGALRIKNNRMAESQKNGIEYEPEVDEETLEKNIRFGRKKTLKQ